LKTRVLLCFIVFFLLFGAKNAYAASYTWSGTTSTLWSVATNWAPNGHPGAFDDIIIPATANQPTVDIASSCNSITISGTTTVTLSAVLAVTTGLTINGSANLTFAGLSSATFGGASSVGNPSTLTIGAGTTITFNSTLTLNANGALINNGNLNSNSAAGISSGNPGTITNNGTITLTASQINVGGGGTFTNSGAIIANTSSTIITGNPVTFKNNLGGSITLTGSTLNIGNGTTTTQAGAITANAASTIIGNNNPPIPNTGTISLSASTLTLNSGARITNSGTGSISAVAGSTVGLGGNPTFINNSAATSSFTLTASILNIAAGGSITNSGTFTTSSVSKVNLNGNPASITNNLSSIFTATSTNFVMVAGSSITNTGGTVNMTADTINASGNPATITNQNSGAITGTFTMSNTAAIFTGTGVIVNSGTFTVYNNSSINMTSASTSSSITNTGTFYAGTSGSPCIITLNGNQPKITNSSFFFVGSTSIIYPTSTSTVVTNNSPGVFTLQSDASGSAAIGAVPVGANPSPSLVGTYNVERYFQGGAMIANGRYVYRNYRIISSPVNTGTASLIYALNYIVGATAGLTTTASSTTNAFVTGAAGGNTTAGNPSLYLYRESIVPSNATFTSGNFIGITSITLPTALHTSDGGTTNSIPIGNGVFFFFRGAATNWAARTTYPFIAPENVTLTSTGSLNQGQVTVKDWYNTGSSTLGYTVTGVGTGANTNTAVRGFNMVGNPYPCSIDWNTAFSGTGITRTNVNPTIWVYNPVTNQYDTYITTSSSTGTSNGGGTDGLGFATNIVASGQGFFVQANSGGAATLVFNEAAKSATSQSTGSNLLMGTPAPQAVAQLLRLKLSLDSINHDEIAIGFNSTASANYNGAEDAVYLPGINAPEGLSSFSSDNVQLAINYLPLPKQAQQVIRLNVQARKTGTYTLQRTTLTAIPQIYDIWLVDNYKKDSLDIRKYTGYAFDVDLADTNSFGSNRFWLVIRQNPALGVHLLNFTAKKAVSGAQTAWKTENEQNYTNFTVERSTNNGVTFTVLGGFTSGAQGTYSFLDKNPPDSTDQYRLKLVDLNGTISYSDMATLMYSNSSGSIAANNISVYPNPANSVINLAIKGGAAPISVQPVSPTPNLSALQAVNSSPSLAATIVQDNGTAMYSIKIISITGAVIKTATSAQPNWQDNVSDLLPGTYIIQVTNNANKSIIGQSTFIKL
jgi:hypothetical protein